MYYFWTPDFPQWAFPINHEHWSRFNKEQHHEIGLILYKTPYWRRMLLPGDAAEVADLTCRAYDIHTYNEPNSK
jgi:hypothetical protein